MRRDLATQSSKTLVLRGDAVVAQEVSAYFRTY